MSYARDAIMIRDIKALLRFVPAFSRALTCPGISCLFLVKGPLNECNRAYKGNRHKIGKSKFSSAVGLELNFNPTPISISGF